MGLPSCIGGLSELRSIDIRSGFLGDLQPPAEPLPRSLENLTKLVEFNAFEQGFVETSKCPTDRTCKASYETMVDCDEGVEEGPMKFRCSQHKAWDQDLNALPIFKWPNLEKFWVDGNALWASLGFFRRAAEAWPKLRTLDLYDNQLATDAQELLELQRCPLLQQVQLQMNNLTGEFPASLLDNALLVRFRVGFNKHLRGCVPRRAPRLGQFTAHGTQIRVEESCSSSVHQEL